MFIKLKEIYSFTHRDKNFNLHNKIMRRKYNNNSLYKTRSKNIIFEETPKIKDKDDPIFETITEECYEFVEINSFSDEDFYHVDYNE